MEPRRETRARVRAVANRTASGLVVFDAAPVGLNVFSVC
jgi:hypothetical protein